MSIRTRIFFGILTVVAVGFYFLLDWIVDDLTPQYRESTEEPLVDAARTLAAIAAETIDSTGDLTGNLTGNSTGQVDIELFRRALDRVSSDVFEAKIYQFTKRNVDFRIYITNRNGIVIFDSRSAAEGNDQQQDYSRWRDVYRTLRGEYGARTTHELDGERRFSVLYVGAPIVRGEEIIGVLTVGKPTDNANQFIEQAERKILVGSAISIIVVVIVSLLVSSMITRPVFKLTEYAQRIGEGKRTVLPKLGGGELASLGAAFEQMRSALEGKKYVEYYVQSLTHEIKSPLSAIQGAVELIDEAMPQEQRNKFLENIRLESNRLSVLVEKLLLLARLENRQELEDLELIDISQLIEEVSRSLEPIFRSTKLNWKFVAQSGATLGGDRFLLRQAVENLINNAVDFSPPGEEISVVIEFDEKVMRINVCDSGSGIPDYALARIFERFYSLKRPASGRKSSGLGLSLVKEVAELHRGSIRIENRDQGGVCACLSLSRELNYSPL